MWRAIGYGAFVLLLFVVIGGVGFVIIRPTSKTVVSAGGKAITINTDGPQTPIVGCAIWRFNTKVYYDKGFNLQGRK